MEPRPLRPADLETAAGWLGLDAPPAGWALDLETGAGFAVEEDGACAGVALLRCLGRVAGVPLLLVNEARRGRGHGRRLMAALREELLRRDARTLVLEADPFDGDSLARLLRFGFKAGPPLLELEWELPPPEEEAEPGPAPGDGELVELAGSLDAGFDPREHLAARCREGARLVGARDEQGALRAAALLEERGGIDLLLLDESAPFALLDALALQLAAAGAGLVRLAAPGRSADALRALLDRGARPAGHRHRLSLEGHPERSDLRRALLWSAR